MSRTLKWVLGILAVLVIVAIAAGAVWAWQNRAQMMAYRPYAVQPNPQATPGVPYGPGPYGFNGHRPMYGFGFRDPMMRGPGRMFGPWGFGLFFLGAALRLLIPLAVLVLVAVVFYQLGKRSTLPRREPPSPPSAPNPPPSQS